MTKKHVVRKVLLSLAVAAVFLLLAAGSSSKQEKTSQFEPGDVIGWGNIQLTVLGMERTQKHRLVELKQDHEFILVRVRFVNKQNRDLSFPDDPDQFFLDVGGKQYKPAAMELDKENPYVYRFAADETASAVYVYMVPVGKTGLVFCFDTYDAEQKGYIRMEVPLDG